MSTIHYTHDNGLATIALNRPEKMNALNQTMIAELTKALREAGRDTAVRCLLLTGNGRGFSAGHDLSEAVLLAGVAEGSFGDHLRAVYYPLIQQIVEMPKPVVAVLNGPAAGIGLSIALAADIRLASTHALLTLGFSKIGMIPDGGANWFLPRLVGYGRAFELAALSDQITAEQAHALGLVNHVIPHEQLGEFAAAYGRKLAAGPTLALALTKRAMQHGLTHTLAQNLDYEAHLQDIAGRSADSREGITAFLEKRPTQFEGK